MSHSNSSLNTFTNCMAKYEHQYILKTPVTKPISPHLTFGAMAHDCLYKAGILRDWNGVDTTDETYFTTIPSEVLYPELKKEFNIDSWQRYFTPIIKQLAKYENELGQVYFEGESYEIQREVKLSFNSDELQSYGIKTAHNFTEPLVGIIDLLMLNKNKAVIMDYKFSTKRKTQDNFDMDSQLQLYAFMVHHKYNIPLRNIAYGYIDIPKVSFDKPVVLKNGTLSRSSSQNVSQEMYEMSVKAVHGEDDYYNCKPGGHYYDCWCNLANVKSAYMSVQYLDEEAYKNIIADVFETANMIETMKKNKMKFLRKYDSYSCSSCEYIENCKRWLNVQ